MSKTALMPRLRFPEFREAGGWEVKPLFKAATFYNGRAYKQEELLEQGKYRVLRVGNFFTNNYWYYSDLELDETKYCDDSDLLYAWSASFGPRIWRGEKVIYHYHIWKVVEKEGIDRSFLFLTLESETETLKAQSANGLGLMHVTKATIEGWECGFPCISEQQKIADCLSSLDELITAETQKLNTLKTHKKGLMQQLFPGEGESVPRLRFPEFREAGEWAVKALGEILPITSSKRVHEADWSAVGVPFYRAREIVAIYKQEAISPLHIPEELYSANIKLSGEITFGHVLVTGVGSIGVPYLIKKDDRFYFKDGNIIWLKNDGTFLSGEMLYRLYETDYVQNQIITMAGVGTVGTYTIDNAKRTIAPFPEDKNEQQRITDCLSSLDDLITTQSQRLGTLKTHKKGLMQQLFPEARENLTC